MSQVSYGTITITDTNDIEEIYMVYAGSSSDTTAPDATNFNLWKRDITQVTGDYIWQRTVVKKSGIDITSSNFQTYYGDPVCITGPEGAEGAAARKIVSVTPYYYLSTSSTQQTGGSWNTTPAAYPATGTYYYWTKTVTAYDSGSNTESTPVLDRALNAANENARSANATAQAANETANQANDTAGEAKTIAEGANSAISDLNQYFWRQKSATTNVPAGSYVTNVPGTTYKADPANGGFNSLVQASGIFLRNGITTLSSWTGSALTFNNPSTGNAQLVIGANGTLQSGNYSRGSDSKFASNGTKIDLIAGDIITQYFRLSQGGESGGPNAGAYIYGTIEALDGRIGTNSTNYWDIGNYQDYNLQNSAKLIGHGSSFIQLGDSSTWRLATNRIHTGWYIDSDSYLHFPEFTDGTSTRRWDYGLHVPSSKDDKFLYIRNANSSTSLSNLVYDLEDSFTTHYWTYKFWIDGEGNVHAPGFYIGDSTTPIGGGTGTIAEKIINSDGTYGKGSATKPVYIDANGRPAETTYSLNAAGAKGIDTSMPTTATDSNVPTTKLMKTFVEGKGYVTSSGVTSVTIGATSPVVSSTATAQTGASVSTTISLANNYGDTKNPYASKTKNYVLAAPATANGAPSFRKLDASDIPDLSDTYLTSYTETDPTVPSWAKAASKPSYSLSEITSADDVKAIEALMGTSGFLKKTAANTWTLDTNTYLTSYTETDPIFVASAAYGITSSDITNWNNKTSNTGTVTSVRVQASSPLTSTTNTASSTTLDTTIKFSNQNANLVLAGPSSGTTAAAPTFRKLVAADIPNLAWSKITSGNDDLKAIEALTGTSGFLKKTAANTWSLDTTTYVSTSRKVNGHALSSDVNVTASDVGLGSVINAKQITNITNEVVDGVNTGRLVIWKGSDDSEVLEVEITAREATSAVNAEKATGDESGNRIYTSYAASLEWTTSSRALVLKSKSGAQLSSVTIPDTTYSFADTYNASTNKGATVATVTNAINALDVSAITGSAGKTITSISETNGKISATYSDISITKSQISDFPTSMTPAAHSHSQIVTVGDQRNVATTPNSYANSLTFQGLKAKATIGSPSNDTYSYLVGLRGWSDSSGGNSHEIAFNNTGIFVRNGATTSWGSWAQIYTTANKPTKSDVGLGNVVNKDTTNADNITSGTLAKERLATSGATAGSYGDSGAQTPSYGGTFKVPYVTVDTYGRVTSISEHTVKIPASDNTTYSLSGALSSHKFTSTLTAGGSGSGTSTSDFTLAAGDNITLTDNTSTRTITIKATDTTYESKAAASGGTAVSLVTTGEKYTWNNKQDKLTNPVTGTGTSGYLVKWNGTGTITNGPQLGSSTTTYLRNDGSWATPVDTKVKLTSQSTDGAYPLIFGPKSITSGTAYEGYYNTGLTYNPSTGTLVAKHGKFSFLETEDLTTNTAIVNGLLDVKGELHTNKWTSSNIASVGGSFYVSPTYKSSTASFQISGGSANSRTVKITEAAFGSASSSGLAVTSWTSGSTVLITGSVTYKNTTYPLGTCKGTLSGALAQATATIQGVNSEALEVLYGILGGATVDAIDIEISLLAIGGTKPVGILLTSYGTSQATYLDIYGGVNPNDGTPSIPNADPNLRIGYLTGLPTFTVGGVTTVAPTGWGIYTDNGYFKGTIAADSGVIGGFKIGETAIATNDKAAITDNTTGIRIDSVNGIGFSGVTYFKKDGTGKIGPWDLSTTYIRNGNITGANNTTVAGVFLGTNGLNISGGTAAKTAYIYKNGTNISVNIGNKLTWDGSTLSVNGAITATSLKIGSDTKNYATDVQSISNKADSASSNWSVIITTSGTPDYVTPSITLVATVYHNGAIATSGFSTPTWSKTNASGTTTLSGATYANGKSSITVTDMDAFYTCTISSN